LHGSKALNFQMAHAGRIRNSPPFQEASCSTRWSSLRCSAPSCSRDKSEALLVSAISSTASLTAGKGMSLV